MGLSICRQLVDLMNGRIWMESREGEGTTVHFRVRLGIADGSGVETGAAPDSLHGLRVLVADDNATSREILAEMIRAWKMEPVLAGSGAEVLKILGKRGSSGGEPEKDPIRLILLDMVMPDMDGDEVARSVRDLCGKAAPRILILSSLGQLVPVRRLNELGIDCLLTKPVRASQLLDGIIRALGTAKGDAHDSERLPAGVAVHPLRVLLAEDNAINRIVAVKLLEERGHSVVAVEDGSQVLSALEGNGFDAVLMDVQMPEMDGLSAAREIRRREEANGDGRRIPIIALTADAMETDRNRCVEAGMDGYVAKPVRSAELYAALEQNVPQAAFLPRLEPASQAAEAKSFDPDAFYLAMGSDPALVREMILAFQEDAERWLAAAESALAEQDAKALHRAAHGLKGMVGNFTTAEPFQRVSELNELTRNGVFTPQAGVLFSAARESLSRLREELVKLGEKLVGG